MLSKTGSYRTNPNGTTTSYDKYGRKTGSFKTDSTGKTTQYDRYAKKLELTVIFFHISNLNKFREKINYILLRLFINLYHLTLWQECGKIVAKIRS